MKYAILDTESTHLDTEFGHLWEAALIIRDTDFPDGGDLEFWWQVRPDLTTADPRALQINKYYDRAHVAHLPIGHGVQLTCGAEWEATADGEVIKNVTVEQIALQLARLLDGATIVANNPRHDRDFLRAFMRANGQAFTASHRMDDIRALLKGYVYGRLAAHGGKVDKAFGLEPARYVRDWLEGATNTLAWEIVGVTQDSATKHTALGDARCVRDVLDGITHGILQ
ncbi:hypothetical protein [Nonomuraea cavernae]|uniref:Exonuclease domain-containing protein n=1 Tax=Nonomuraea cavernae TaxID=2045107 RepID=A0A917YSK6_9ACTN|nr:hypothetical protein [Nonomuraea cavernae]MCA2184704.1 hypothetical protein [Nonomuraea cavernae]GGO63011.1 hypothetical protein GCM10012289_08930 [Nonomuraea cavernae]